MASLTLFVPSCSSCDSAGRLPCVRRAVQRPITFCSAVPRRAVLQMAAAAALYTTHIDLALAAEGTTDAAVTDRAYLDLRIGGQTAAQRVVIGLFGDAAPNSVGTFKQACNNAVRGRGGAVAGYKYSTGSRVVRGRFVELGRVKQVDPNQTAGVPQRLPAGVRPSLNNDLNELRHDARGVVGVKKGGGAFEFVIAFNEDQALDEEHIVIGRVMDGFSVLDALEKVPVTKKTSRDGFRKVGKAIGDARAKVDVRPCHTMFRLCTSQTDGGASDVHAYVAGR